MDQAQPSDRLEELLAHRAWVKRVARALVLDPNSADDLEQEVWLDALRSHPPRSPKAWLGTVLRRVASNKRRDDGRRRAREGAAPGPPSSPDPGEWIERAEVIEQVARAVRTMEEPYRTAVFLRYFEDLPPPAIATHLGVPLETVRTRLRRALALLRGRLDREHQGDRRTWALLLLPLAQEPPPVASGAAVSASVLGAILMTLKAKALIAAGLVLLLGGWLFLERQGDEPVQTGHLADSPGAEGPTAPASAQERPGKVAPARESAATSAATAGAAAPPLTPKQTEARILRVFCGFEGATITARFQVCGGDPDPDPVVGTTDSTGAALLPVPRHPNLMDGFEVEGRAAGYATTVVHMEEYPKTKSVTLQMQHGQQVCGRVVDERGLPVAGAQVEGGNEPAVTRADGAFEVSGYGSAVWLTVRHKDFLNWSPPNEGIPVPSTGVEIRLSRGLTVSGRVTFEDGRPAEGASVLVELEPLPGGPSRAATTGADGAFMISGFSPGPVRVKCISGGASWGIVRDEVRTVAAGAEAVDFVLSSHLVHVCVRDEAGRPFRNAELIWWGYREDIDVMRGHLPCEAGERDIEVPPGIRLVVAVRFRGYATGLAEATAAGPAGRREVVITMRRLGPPGRLEIVAKDPRGRAVRKVRVTLKTIAGLPLMWFGGSREFDLDAMGAAIIEEVPAQQVVAEVATPFDPASETDFLVPWRRSFLIKSGGTERLEATFRQGGRLRVQVVGAEGNPRKSIFLRLRDSKGNARPIDFCTRRETGSWSSQPRLGDLALAPEPIPAGSYTIEVLEYPYVDLSVVGSAPVEIVEGKVVDAVVRIEK